jgi:hypothetical protein
LIHYFFFIIIFFFSSKFSFIRAELEGVIARRELVFVSQGGVRRRRHYELRQRGRLQGVRKGDMAIFWDSVARSLIFLHVHTHTYITVSNASLRRR